MSAQSNRHFSWSRANRTTDLTLPSDMNVPEYEHLREAERKLDWTMARHVMELQDSLGKTMQQSYTLRVYITQTAKNQPWQSTPEGADEEEDSVDFDTGKGIPTWELKIEGKLLNKAILQEMQSTSQILPPPPPRKFTSLLKSMIIETDRDRTLYPEEAITEWHRHPSLPAEDGFILRRRGDRSHKMRLILHLDQTPEQCLYHNNLFPILGMKQGTRSEAVSGVYHYIKRKGLQDKSDRRVVKLDNTLRQAGFPENLMFQDIPTVIHRYLSGAPPVEIHHTINLEDPAADGNTVAYDIDISLDDIDYKSRIRDVLTRLVPPLQSRVVTLDQEISEAVHALRTARQKQRFFQNFSDDPQTFIGEWLESQSRDLETILGTERGVPSELMRRSEFYKMPWVDEAVAIHEGVCLANVPQTQQIQHAQPLR